jgi:hypothetical protein
MMILDQVPRPTIHDQTNEQTKDYDMPAVNKDDLDRPPPRSPG